MEIFFDQWEICSLFDETHLEIAKQRRNSIKRSSQT
jgi:hypothetical protein